MGDRAAVERAKVQRITPPSLRHTAASMAVSTGANVLAVSRMLGHENPQMTLTIYADLFDSDLDKVGAALDRAWKKNASKPRPEPEKGRRGRALTSANADTTQCGRRDSNPHALSSTGT